MKIGYFDGSLGASGDMIVASLLDAGLSLSRLQQELKKVPITGYKISSRQEERSDPRIGHCRLARRFVVGISRKEEGRSPGKISSLISRSGLHSRQKARVLAIFERLAKAEKEVHGKVPSHFHQVGETDSMVDVVSVVVGLDLLGITKVYSSYLNLGSPAPATVLLLNEFPVKIDPALPECTTPTAAAILTELAVFEPPPIFRLLAVGFGTGTRSVPSPNILSFFVAEPISSVCEDEVLVLETNLDDMPPYAYEKVFQNLQTAGILDFILMPGLMKKSRPGNKLEIILRKEDLGKVLGILFTQTTTFGVRIKETRRVVLEREFRKTRVAGKPVRIKVGRYRGGVVQMKPEYEDIKDC
ncbi:MAG: LarC family nickel insertion protein [Candidatus Omnitrophota bacterium]